MRNKDKKRSQKASARQTGEKDTTQVQNNSIENDGVDGVDTGQNETAGQSDSSARQEDTTAAEGTSAEQKKSEPLMLLIARKLLPKDYEAVSKAELDDHEAQIAELLRLNSEQKEDLGIKIKEINSLREEITELKNDRDKYKTEADGLRSKVLEAKQRIDEIDNLCQTAFKEESYEFLGKKGSECISRLFDSYKEAKTSLLDYEIKYKELNEENTRLKNAQKVQPQPRTFAEMLNSPAEREKTELQRWVDRHIDKYIRNYLSGIAEIPEDMTPKTYLQNLQSELKILRSELEAERTLDKFAERLNSGDEKINDRINVFVCDTVNSRIKEENRQLPVEGSTFEGTFSTLAETLSAPRTDEEAVAQVREKWTEAISQALGRKLDDMTSINDAVEDYVAEQLRTRIIEKIGYDLPIDELIEKVKSDMVFASRIYGVLKEDGCATIEEYKDKAINVCLDKLYGELTDYIWNSYKEKDGKQADTADNSKDIKDLLKKISNLSYNRELQLNGQRSAIDAISVAVSKTAEKEDVALTGKTVAEKVESLLSKLSEMLDAERDILGCVTAKAVDAAEKEKLTLAGGTDTEKAVSAISKLGEKIEELKNEQTAKDEELNGCKSSIDALKGCVLDTVTKISTTVGKPVNGKDESEKLADLAVAVASKVEDDARKAAILDTSLAETKAKLETTFKAYLDSIKRGLDSIEHCAEKICASADRSGFLAKAVDEKVLTNPAGGFDDFSRDLMKIIDNAEPGDTDGISGKIRATVLEYQQSTSATWMDVLMRMYAYAKVPFIAAQFFSKQIVPSEIAKAVEALSEILDVAGLKLIVPDLFVAYSNDGDFEFESIRNIESYVDDVAAHVDNPDRIVDMMCVGISHDGQIVKKPVVSVFN